MCVCVCVWPMMGICVCACFPYIFFTCMHEKYDRWTHQILGGKSKLWHFHSQIQTYPSTNPNIPRRKSKYIHTKSEHILETYPYTNPGIHAQIQTYHRLQIRIGQHTNTMHMNTCTRSAAQTLPLRVGLACCISLTSDKILVFRTRHIQKVNNAVEK